MFLWAGWDLWTHLRPVLDGDCLSGGGAEARAALDIFLLSWGCRKLVYRSYYLLEITYNNVFYSVPVVGFL